MVAKVSVHTGVGWRVWLGAGSAGLTGLVLGWQLALAQAGMPLAVAKTDPRSTAATHGATSRLHAAQPIQADALAAEGASPATVSAANTACDTARSSPGRTEPDAMNAPDKNQLAEQVLAGADRANLTHGPHALTPGQALANMVSDVQLEPAQRVEAWATLNQHFGGTPRAQELGQLLAAADQQGDVETQRDVLESLRGKMHADLVPHVEALLKSADPELREEAAHRLAELRDNPSARNALLLAATQTNASPLLSYLASRP